MDIRERLDHWKEPAVTGGPMGGVPRWLYVLILGAACAAYLVVELAG